ncbi:MAG: hypothetical protein EPN85_13010 [Bacteroidetes bacterium]|nr:MAG: hypothetical protein EPN85_13010 [Bacteroidota bacterium]
MNQRQAIYRNFSANKDGSEAVCINDLRDKEFQNEKLTDEEIQALLNFDRFRLTELNKVKGDFDFNARYCELQIMANIADYKEFLKEEYFFAELL